MIIDNQKVKEKKEKDKIKRTNQDKMLKITNLILVKMNKLRGCKQKIEIVVKTTITKDSRYLKSLDEDFS